MPKINAKDPKFQGDNGGIELFPKGNYFLAGKSLKRGESSQKKTPYVDVVMVAYGGDLHGRKTKERFYLSEKSLFRIANLADACGYEEDFDTDDDSDLGQAILGVVFRGTIGVETPKAGEQWKPRNKLERVYKLTEAEEREVDAIVDRLGDPLTDSEDEDSDDPEGPSSVGGGGVQDDPTTVSDDDIPF